MDQEVGWWDIAWIDLAQFRDGWQSTVNGELTFGSHLMQEVS